MGYAIGIDVGTANTRVAVFRNGKVEVIPDTDGRRSIPSYVAFTERCRLFGSAAKAQAASNPKNTVYGIKRVLGERLEQWQVGRYTRISPNDVSLELTQAKDMAISVNYKKRVHRVLPVQVFGMLLVQARTNAEAYLGEPVHDAVISVPAHFDRRQLLEVENAAELAGLNVMYVSTSIESIALYYAFTARQPTGHEDEKVCVFLDLGAGFFNAGLVSIEDGQVEMISAASDKDRGGDDLIDRVHNYFAAEIRRKWDWDVNTDIRARRRLRVACEAATTALSSQRSTQLYVDSLRGEKDFSETLTRQKLEQLCQDLFAATLIPIDHVFRGASGRDKASVNEVVITGGCSRIPKLQEVWSDYFDQKPLAKVIHPDEGEVLGSAVYAAIFSAQPGRPPLLTLPIIPLNVGVEVEGGIMSTVVPRNTPSPTLQMDMYLLSDFALEPHKRPLLRFYQGDKTRVKDNLLIGTLDLSELPLKLEDGRSETKIQITVEVKCIQEVKASAVLEGKHFTSPESWHVVTHRDREEMEKLTAQAVAYEEDDAMEQELVAERCALDSRLASLADTQLPAFQTTRMEGLLDSLRGWRDWLDELDSGNLDDYRKCHRALDQVDRDMKAEAVRGEKISGLLTYAEELRTKLLDTTQTPKVEALLKLVNHVTDWVGQNEQAQTQEYEENMRLLKAISADLTVISPPSPLRESTTTIDTRLPAQNPEAVTPTQSQGPRALDELFPESGWDGKSKYNDTEFEGIASYLRNTGHEKWSKVPRIYTVSRLIGQAELVDIFLQRGLTDICLPFSDNTLPKVLKQPHRAQFLHTQEAVFSKALELERGTRLNGNKPYRMHAHFKKGEPLPFKVIGNLGAGAHGSVDKVVSMLSYMEFARKRFRRSATNSRDVKSFLNELKILKQLSHRHCIDMVGSYSDPQYFALIIHPVAECNLEKYYSLALDDIDKRSILQGFFGCLAGTLEYLHSQKVVHQDIKPQNILVKDNSHVLVTDFGIARSWEGLTRATTTADLDRTWLYAAPEVARGGPKNESADVWSLGCVFLEMFTVLKGQSPADVRAFFKRRSDSTSFHDNAAPGHVAAWVRSLRERSPFELNGTLDWLESMLQVEPRYRCKPFELFDKTVAASESTSVLFCGACCRDKGESAAESNNEDTDGWSEGNDEDV